MEIKEDKEKVKAAAVAEVNDRLLVHAQVKRIREEEMRITCEEVRSARNRIALHHLSTHVDNVLCSRSPPILPTSPLGNKATIGSSFR